MYFESKLIYTNKMYKKENVYIAKIFGDDAFFKFGREFIEFGTLCINSIDTKSHKYFWHIKECGIYEWNEDNGLKSFRKYFKYDSRFNTMKFVTIEEVKDMFKEENIKDTDAYKQVLEKAKKTGIKQLLNSSKELCNSDKSQCKWDLIENYVLPNGEIKKSRCHTFS